MNENGVIYCRVSSRDQVDGTSLESQEAACLEYARRHNIDVARVFIEEGESAKFANRTQLIELLGFCKKASPTIAVLIVWKVDRFARNVEDHYTIKAMLKRMGVRIVSVTEPIQADPNGQLLETILAGFAQFDNENRAARTVCGMRQRIREGIWPWNPPLGYLTPKAGKKTQPDTPDPHSFEPIKKAWQIFATGAYRKADIVRMLDGWGIRAYRGRPVSPQSLDHMFANPYYAGILRDPWSGEEYTGRHTPMVSVEVFSRVQDIVSGRGRSQPRHRLNDMFPLRGHVRCPTCQALMTGYFAKGKRRRYPYYKCFARSCPTRTKSYTASAVNDEFSAFLAEASIPHFLAQSIITELIAAYWDAATQSRQATARLKQEADRLKEQLHELISMRAAKLVTDEEFKIKSEDLRRRMHRSQAQVSQKHISLTPNDVSDLASSLSNLEPFWRTMPATAKRVFGDLAFASGYIFQKLRTTEPGLLFKTLGASENPLTNVAALDPDTLNTIFGQLRKLLAIIQHGKGSENDKR